MSLPQPSDANEFLRRLTPKWSRYIPITPTEKQHLGLVLDIEEIFWGGAAGGGKSVWMLASALQWADHPDYDALLIRKNFPDLAQPGGLMDMSHDWLGGTDARWNEQNKRWNFPSGATLSFGHLDNAQEIKRYKGGEYKFVGIDEITDLHKREAMFLHSRLRRKVGSPVPLRFRATSNPGGIGHDWVKARYLDNSAPDRLFIPATLGDNPHVDQESYLRSLDRLDPITRERLLKGDWNVTEGGKLFDRSWFNGKYQDAAPILVGGRVRFWDLAATTGEESCETAGVLMSRTVHGLWVIEDVIHGKWAPGERDGVLRQTAEMDGRGVKIVIEEEPGSGGKAQNEAIIRMLAGWRVESLRATGTKFVRAGAFASQCQAGNVYLVRGPWNHAFVEQLHAADPELEGDILLDMMDAAAGAFNKLVSCSLNPMAVETLPKGLKYHATPEEAEEEKHAREEEALVERLRARRSVYDQILDPKSDDDLFEGLN